MKTTIVVTTKAQFKEFKDTFIKYQKLLGLTGYKVYFRHEQLCGCFADIITEDKVTKVRYSSVCDVEDRKDVDPKRTARHEVIHLLTARLEILARSRYLDEDDITLAVEEIANILEPLI